MSGRSRGRPGTSSEPPALHPDEAWTAVRSRDAGYDGRFVFGVVTTGVYCRPGCAARTPKRENVLFFAGRAEAQVAGFRACRRCRPDDDGPTAMQRTVDKAREYLDARLDGTVTLKELAQATHTSAWHLQRSFRQHVGMTPREYVQAQRALRFRQNLRAGDTVSRATFGAGYSSTSRMYEHADASPGMTPSAYRRGGAGVRITYVIAATRLGRVLVAATERGVCAVSLGDDDATLEAALRREYPQAIIERAADGMQQHVDEVVACVEGTARDSRVPLDVQATDFQLRVWKALREIPPGETRTYLEVARSIGQPSAARAVARACASNRVAVLIPCHRVVRSDGDLSGYRWGVERKRLLLAAETGAAAQRDTR